MDIEGSSLSWAVFFCGTKRLANMVHQPEVDYDGDLALMIDWIFYHDTMYKFSIVHFTQRVHQHLWLAQQRKIISKADLPHMRQLVPGRLLSRTSCLYLADAYMIDIALARLLVGDAGCAVQHFR